MSLHLGVIMDDFSAVHYEKDSTIAMLWEAVARGYVIEYFQQHDLFFKNGIAYGNARRLSLPNDPNHWYQLETAREIPLASLQVILMRKDPPFNENYIYSTYILEQAEREGVLVVNKPQALRDANEKLYTLYFPQCCPETLVSQSVQQLHAFWQEQTDIVCKPLNAMGGTSIFRLSANDVNANVIFDVLTKGGTEYIIAQRFIPEIAQGDKRILLINGTPIPYALARVPQGNDWRGNLAVGAKGKIQPLTPRDQWICEQIAPSLRERGLYFVGIDVIGDYLTEVNVTSPTGIRELQLAQKEHNIAGELLNFVESKLKV